jgi:predicted PurR-regulated permease PerM
MKDMKNGTEGQSPERQIVININRNAVFLILKLTGILILLGLFLWILPYSGQVITPFVVSVLLSFFLNPVVLFLENRGLGRTLSVMLIMVVFVFLVIGLVVFLSPVLSQHVQSIAKSLEGKEPTQMTAQVREFLENKAPLMKNPEISQRVTAKMEGFIYKSLDQSMNIVLNVFSSIITCILIPLMTFFLLKDGRAMKKKLIQMVPNRYFEMSLNLVFKISGQLSGYIRGQMIVSFGVGALSVIALYILDVPYFLFIGVFAGIANVIPYFGPIAGAVPAVILNVIDKGDLSAGLMVVIAFIIIRLIDDTLLSPNILAKTVELHPLLVVAAIFIGGHMFGILGLLLCVPAASIIKVTVKEVLWSFKNYRLI